MSWLSSFVKHNRGFIGNAVKNLSPALAFTPLGVLGAGAAGALGRAIQPGAKLGDIAKSGVSNAAVGGGAKLGMSALQSAFAPSSSAAVNALPSATGGAATSMNVDGIDMPAFSTPAASSGSRLGSVASGVGHFVKDNPMAVGLGLQGLGSAATAGSENAYRRAQTHSIDIANQAAQDDLERRRRMAELLGPLQQAFTARIGTLGNSPIAPNPYNSGGY